MCTMPQYPVLGYSKFGCSLCAGSTVGARSCLPFGQSFTSVRSRSLSRPAKTRESPNRSWETALGSGKLLYRRSNSVSAGWMRLNLLISAAPSVRIRTSCCEKLRLPTRKNRAPDQEGHPRSAGYSGQYLLHPHHNHLVAVLLRKLLHPYTPIAGLF